MIRYRKRWIALAAAVVGFSGVSVVQEPAKEAPKPAGTSQETKKAVSVEDKKRAQKALVERLEVANTLKEKADSVTKKIGELASSGKLTTSDEAIKMMQQMVEELKQIREALQKLSEEVDGIKGWIEGQNESLPVLVNDVESLKRVSMGNYVQFQFTDTQEGPNSSGGSNRTNNDGFMMRRFRISQSNKIDSKTSMKLSFDVAAGSQRVGAELKDAMLVYDIEPSDVAVGKQLVVGQQNMGLGYELERSSSEREFPERAAYNRTFFNGGRNRGIRYKHGLGNGVWFEAGVWNDLSMSDPQQNAANTYRNLNGTEPAYTLTLKKASANYEVGVSLFEGQRLGTAAATNTTWRDTNGNGQIDSGEVSTINIPATSATNRRFLYLDCQYAGLFVPNLTVRAEAMWGHDRNPTLNSNGTPVATKASDPFGWQANFIYSLNPRNQVLYRYEFFNPFYAANDDITTQGIGYQYWINPGARVVLTHEFIKQQGFDRKDNLTTIRMQFKLH